MLHQGVRTMPKAMMICFVVFVVTVFVKGFLFHWFCFHSFLFSSLWTYPTEFFRFWFGKIIPALFLGAFVFLTKRYWWTVIVNVIADIWMIANLIYYKAQHLFLSVEMVKLAANMKGVEDSILSYLGPDIYIFLIISLFYAVFVYFLHRKSVAATKRYYLPFAVSMVLVLILSVLSNVFYKRFIIRLDRETDVLISGLNAVQTPEFGDFPSFPFGQAYFYGKVYMLIEYNSWASLYVKDYSILSYLPASVIYTIVHPEGEKISLTDEQKNVVQSFIYGKRERINTQQNLIVIMFESLESWALEDVCGYTYMPCLNRIRDRQNSVLYCDRIHSQVRHANSADGLMEVVTGLLPISNGATCVLYGNNDFPSFAECYDHSCVFECSDGLWNISTMANSYHFKQLQMPKKSHFSGDGGMFERINQYIDTVQCPFCVVACTMTSHVPFAHGALHPKYKPEDMPGLMSAYLNSVAYTDSCIGQLFDKIQQSELKDNTTIVVTGDHTIFRSVNSEIDDYAESQGINMQTTKTFTPLLIYSPAIDESRYIHEELYQMDIYPTILPLIGLDNYYWRGVGVNVLDEEAHSKRVLSDVKAYQLSDMIIRSNYFAE